MCQQPANRAIVPAGDDFELSWDLFAAGVEKPNVCLALQHADRKRQTDLGRFGPPGNPSLLLDGYGEGCGGCLGAGLSRRLFSIAQAYGLQPEQQQG